MYIMCDTLTSRIICSDNPPNVILTVSATTSYATLTSSCDSYSYVINSNGWFVSEDGININSGTYNLQVDISTNQTNFQLDYGNESIPQEVGFTNYNNVTNPTPSNPTQVTCNVVGDSCTSNPVFQVYNKNANELEFLFVVGGDSYNSTCQPYQGDGSSTSTSNPYCIIDNSTGPTILTQGLGSCYYNVFLIGAIGAYDVDNSESENFWVSLAFMLYGMVNMYNVLD